LAVALIVAAGRGERLGADGPKALVELAGRPLLQWSVDVLRAVPAIEQIVVALPAGAAAPTGTIGVQGGAVRSQSVRNALGAADPGQDPVLVHDAARPLLTVALVEQLLAALDEGIDGAIAAAPVTDTVKRVAQSDERVAPDAGAGSPGTGSASPEWHARMVQHSDMVRQAGMVEHAGIVRETLDRSELWAVQTPQIFRRATLERALDVPDEVLEQATDDAWLVERIGGRVRIVAAPRENLKVTTELDLRLAELLLARRPA
jgi:2-C-methyl-D-erythritol 4-phosphate cytidylyltransferase